MATAPDQTLPRSIHRTAVACALVSAAFALVVASITAGGSAWTFEGERRLRVTQGRLAAAPVRVETAAGQQHMLWSGTPSNAVYLVDFIYATCESVCSALGGIYTQMQAELASLPTAQRNRVALVSVSFDPKDDRQALARYARTHRADPGLWTVARPTAAHDRERLLDQMRIVAIPDGRGGFVHNGAIHLVDAHGRVLAVHDYAQWRDALAGALAVAERLP